MGSRYSLCRAHDAAYAHVHPGDSTDRGTGHRGGAIGLAGALWAVGAISRTLPPSTLAVPEVHVDASVLCFAFAATVVSGLLFGLAPAWRMTDLDIHKALKQSGRGSSGGMRSRLRNGLAAAELALATILLIGAAVSSGIPLGAGSYTAETPSGESHCKNRRVDGDSFRMHGCPWLKEEGA